MITLKIFKERLRDKARVSIFTYQRFIYLKIVMYISFALEGVFPNNLETMFYYDDALACERILLDKHVFRLYS